MKTRVIFLSAALVLLMPSTSFSQVGNILKNRVNKAINKRIEDKIDTAVNKRVGELQEQNADAQAQEGEAPRGQGAENINLGNLLSGKITARYNETYNFNNRIYMVTEMYDKKDVVRSDMYVYFSDSSPDGGFEAKMKGTSEGEEMSMTMISVFDAANKVFIVLTDMGAMKMGVISEIPEETQGEGQLSGQVSTEKGISKAVVTRTGNSKVIAGYKCDEYLFTDPETKEHGNLWVTRDLRLTSDKRIYSKGGAPMYYDHPDLADGAVLAMESYSAKNELQLKSETKEITKGFDHAISVAGYPLRQVNFSQAGRNQQK